MAGVCQGVAAGYVFTVLLGARAACPRRRDAGGTPALAGAWVTPGVNTYAAGRRVGRGALTWIWQYTGWSTVAPHPDG